MPTRKPKLAKEYDLAHAKEHGRKKTTKAQHCIKAIAGKVVKSRSLYLINFCGGGQVIALKSATALIQDRSLQAENPTLIWHICIFANAQSQLKKCKRAKSANAKREKKGEITHKC